mgnify:CR=1 FL=1
MTLPKDKIQYHPILIDLSYRDWATRDFQGFPKHPDEFADVDLDAYDEILHYGEIVRYVRHEERLKARGG